MLAPAAPRRSGSRRRARAAPARRRRRARRRASPSAVVERLLLPAEAAHDHAVRRPPGRAARSARRASGRPADRDERLRAAPRRVAEPLGLAAREDDRLHQPFVAPFAGAARPIPSYVKPAARIVSGSSMLRPSTKTAVRIAGRDAPPSRRPRARGHSVTSTTASAPRTASSTVATCSTPCRPSACATGSQRDDLGALGEQARRRARRRAPRACRRCWA